MPRALLRYKRLVETLGLRQLDVYRVSEGGRLAETLRVADPESGRVVLVRLGTSRESLSPLEFLDKLVEELARGGLRVSERSLERARRALKAWEEGG